MSFLSERHMLILIEICIKDVPHYYEMIKSPMWLKKVQTNTNRSAYRDMETFQRDIMQIWANARIYNVDGSEIFELANELEELFQRVYQDKMLELNSSQEARQGSSALEGTSAFSGTPQPSGPRLKLKLGNAAGRASGKAGRSAGKRGRAESDGDDDDDEEDARMSDASE
jgi:ATP-dependent helicase STH1/SNF2